MPLDPGDPYYRAELISPTIAAMEHPLCDAFGVGLGNFGSKGNEVHLSGYHRSRNWVLHSPDSAHGSRDYSVQLALDTTADGGGDGDDVAAFDFTPGVWGSSDNRAKMKLITQRLLAACQNHDPRVAALREFAGTLNGTSVVTWDCSRNAFKTPFDSSHLDHVHGSIYRTRTRWDHQGIVDVMLGKPDTSTIGDTNVATLYRAPNGGIVLADNGVCVAVVSTAELGAIAPAPPLVNLPQALFDRFVAAHAPGQATLSADQFADFKAGAVPIVHDAAQSGAAAALDGATLSGTIRPAAS